MAQKDFTEEEIRDVAYSIWQKYGQPHGQDEAHWQEAIAALNAPKPKAPKKTASKPAAKKAAPKAAAKPKAARKKPAK